MPNAFRWLLGALFGGALGAAIWSLAEAYLHVHLHWMALGVGALAGLGAASAADSRRQWSAGVAAALGFAIALFGARVYESYRESEREEVLAIVAWEKEALDETQRTGLVARVIAEERDARGQTYEAPSAIADPTGSPREWYPDELWLEAEARRQSMTPEQLEALLAPSRAEFLAQIQLPARELVLDAMTHWTRMTALWAGGGLALAVLLGVFGGATTHKPEPQS
jgi:hypothetical protein